MTDSVLTFPCENLGAEGWPHAQRASVRPSHRDRIVADSSDRVTWLRERSRGVTATDAARLASAKSIAATAADKHHGSGFTGNAFTDHGKTRETHIAAWVLSEHGIPSNRSLFHAPAERRHLATPDGVLCDDNGRLQLSEIKTTTKSWRSIPRGYLRQVWWQQYVLGAERTLVVWEEHKDFVPVSAHPQCLWVDRDDAAIETLVALANELLRTLAGD